MKETQRSKDLSEALIKCKAFAKRGYKLAKDAVSTLENVIANVSKTLQAEIKKLENKNFNDNGTNNMLAQQLSSIRSSFEILPQRLAENISALSKTAFSITLFGRTMAGKSTLMEILTEGNGSSIGKGAQRTTRDVRTYKYENLDVTDVPGIAAFEGKDDEDTAFKAARKSDLVLFLITDDAPQASETECLNKIRALGKPVICLINVKANIDKPSDIKMFRHDIQKKFDNRRLDEIKKQFFDFGKNNGQDWHNIRFAYVHLKSAFLSKQSDFKKNRDDLYALSHFGDVEELIINEVCKNGSFYKLKAFSDIVVVPLVAALETLFRQSAQNSKQGVVLIAKREKLKKWTDDFNIDAKQRIETFLMSVLGDLQGEIASFAEDNYDNSKAGSKWNKILKTFKVEQKASDLLKQLGKECEEEIREISREINSEIKFLHSDFLDSSINMPNIIDGKKIWEWTTAILSGGVIIAGILGIITGPVGWISLSIAIIGFIGSNILIMFRELRIYLLLILLMQAQKTA